MKSLRSITTCIIITSLLFSSCSNDDNESFTPTASDITVAIDENPDSGTILGTITTNLTENLNYTFVSQSVNNALSINSTTGEVSIGDGSKFDFETNPSLTASVTVTNGTDEAISKVSVSLNNVDDIASFLTTSKNVYEVANAKDWVLITKDEYNLLASNLNEVSRVGTTDGQYQVEPTIFLNSVKTFANNNGINIPKDSYVFAFTYYTIRSQAPSIVIKQSSTSITEGYSDLGNPTPEHSGGGNVYFVIKSNDSKITSEGFLAMYMGDNNAPGFRTDITESMNVSNGGNVNTLNNQPNNWLYLYQGLSTTQKQWD